jgi:3-deoxy-D-manno-octulosonic acid (KDO) 8-phosphate synthase
MKHTRYSLLISILKAEIFFLLAGPCAIEGEMAMQIAEKISWYYYFIRYLLYLKDL